MKSSMAVSYEKRKKEGKLIRKGERHQPFSGSVILPIPPFRGPWWGGGRRGKRGRG